MAGNGGLPDTLARADDRKSRLGVRHEDDRVEPEVGADVRDPRGERPGGEAEASPRAYDGLVGEVDDDLEVHVGEGVLEVVPERDTVVGRAIAELLAATEHHGADELVVELGERGDDDVGIVLPVDERERPHWRPVSSVSIRAVYFSYSSVSTENWMIRSCPWNGYLRQTSTCLFSISIRL